MRAPILDSIAIEDFLVQMAEGDSAAATILTSIYCRYQSRALAILLMMHAMNIRGRQITLALQICENNLERMVKAIQTCNGHFIQHLNLIAAQNDIDERAQHTANTFEVKCQS